MIQLDLSFTNGHLLSTKFLLAHMYFRVSSICSQFVCFVNASGCHCCDFSKPGMAVKNKTEILRINA